MRFQLIHDHRDEFPVRRMCNELNVSHSGYYAWRERPASAREMANQELYDKIEAVYNDNHRVYGSPRIYRELRDQGIACSKNRVARLMRVHGIRGIPARKRWPKRRSEQRPAGVENHLARDFSAAEPNTKWVTDITYIATQEGWLYLAVIMDLFSRRIVGWAMSPRSPSARTRSFPRAARAACS